MIRNCGDTSTNHSGAAGLSSSSIVGDGSAVISAAEVLGKESYTSFGQIAPAGDHHSMFPLSTDSPAVPANLRGPSNDRLLGARDKWRNAGGGDTCRNKSAQYSP